MNGEEVLCALVPRWEVFARYPVSLGALSLKSGRSTPCLDFDGQYDFTAVIPEIQSENKPLFGAFTDGKAGVCEIRP